MNLFFLKKKDCNEDKVNHHLLVMEEEGLNNLQIHGDKELSVQNQLLRIPSKAISLKLLSFLFNFFLLLFEGEKKKKILLQHFYILCHSQMKVEYLDYLDVMS